MGKGRLEAFSDGVLAIIITIMVLELKVPHGVEFSALRPLAPVFFSYILSFLYIGIYWNNHHHMLHGVKMVNGVVLWANMHLLFWLSLLPFTTALMGEHSFARWPVILYGFVLLMCALAYYLLAHCLTSLHGKESDFAKALGDDLKGKISLVVYTVGVAASFLQPVLGMICYSMVALIWLIPDKRFERS